MQPIHLKFSIGMVTTALLLLCGRAAAVTVAFEDWPSMNNVLATVPAAARLSNQLATASGVVFDSVGGAPYVAVVKLGAGHATSGTNGMGGVNAAGTLNYAIPVRAQFVLPADPTIPAVVDFVSVRCDSNSIAGTVTLEAFDTSGASLGSITRNDAPGLTLMITHSGINSVRISESSATVAFDDLTFSAPAPANPLRLTILPDGAQVLVRWTTRSNSSYQLQFTPTLESGGWTNLGPTLMGFGTNINVPEPADQPRRFYRVQFLP